MSSSSSSGSSIGCGCSSGNINISSSSSSSSSSSGGGGSGGAFQCITQCITASEIQYGLPCNNRFLQIYVFVFLAVQP
jgi:hypothetical protein